MNARLQRHTIRGRACCRHLAGAVPRARRGRNDDQCLEVQGGRRGEPQDDPISRGKGRWGKGSHVAKFLLHFID